MPLDILVVDDEKDIRDLIAGVLEDEGYEPRTASGSDEALAALSERRPALAILDVWLQGSKLDGIELLAAMRAMVPDLPVIVISGHGNIETAVAAIKRGAQDFIEKPFQADALLLAIRRATELERLRRENDALRRSSSAAGSDLIGESAAITNLRATLKKVAQTGSRVLIEGPPGSGKELAARLVHRWSERGERPFVTVSSARLSPDRVEAALFGTEEGEPGARIGLFEQAHGGTLYLDEISDMPLDTQAKILRVLTDQGFRRVGGTTPIQVRVRVLSSTSRDLKKEIAEGRFREDLYYRLAVVPVSIPPLETRREDIEPIAVHFLQQFAAERGVPTPELTQDAIIALQSYEWPGNVRQLRNAMERAIIFAGGQGEGVIGCEDLPPDITDDGPPTDGGSGKSIMGAPLREAREAFEREYLRVQIRRFSGNISRTATFIGMERSALHRKLKALELSETAVEERKD